MTEMDRATRTSGDGGRPARRDTWHRSYLLAALALDGVVLVMAVTLAEYVRFGMAPEELSGRTWTYSALGIVIAGGWWIALQFSGATDARLFGHGPEEYRRIVNASLITFGVLAIVSLLFKQDLSRGYLAVAFPVGLAGLLLCRKLLRTWLNRRRLEGEMSTDVLVVGGLRSARTINTYFDAHRDGGLRVSGVWVPDQPDVDDRWLLAAERIPVLGSKTTLAEAVTIAGAEAVIVTDTEHLGAHALKELTWEIEGLDVELLVSPNVMDISTPRIALRTVGSMPFLQLAKPQYDGASRLAKLAFDRLGAAALVLAFSPFMLATAIAVKTTSKGPVFYRQERVGRGGEPFGMLKFRSMQTGSDAKLKELLEAQGHTAGPLAKVDNDPRITKVGRFIRRYSIDELPQLFNVLGGTMSLVGPRPQREFEVELYDDVARRRLHVRPGMTGLWQVSGRSDLSWEDAIRLDTFYVENWSMAGDLSILWRTLRAVVSRSGAY